jgi:DNA polymerase IV
MYRYIAHVDMDAFFASIEQRDNRNFQSKPVIIGADPKSGGGRGVVSTCSYEARKFGIKSAMPISTAYRLCPNGIYLRPNMKKYLTVSQEICEIFHYFTPHVEMISVDEAFMDITFSHHIFGGPGATCCSIKNKIKQDTALSCSIGMAPNKFVAKIASDLKKPDGFVEVSKGEVTRFLEPLPVDKMWGVGKKGKEILNSIGINTIGDMARARLSLLYKYFGKNAMHFWELAKGIDERRVEPVDEVKSISNEVTFDEDSFDRTEVLSSILGLCEKVSGRLRQGGLKARTITLKVRLSGFRTYTLSKTITIATNFSDIIYEISKSIFLNFDSQEKGIRLVGLKASGLLDTDIRDTLFSESGKIEKKERMHKAMDFINNKFGNKSIYRARIKK